MAIIAFLTSAARFVELKTGLGSFLGNQRPHRGAAEKHLLHRRRPVERPGGFQLGRRQQRPREPEEAAGGRH